MEPSALRKRRGSLLSSCRDHPRYLLQYVCFKCEEYVCEECPRDENSQCESTRSFCQEHACCKYARSYCEEQAYCEPTARHRHVLGFRYIPRVELRIAKYDLRECLRDSDELLTVVEEREFWLLDEEARNVPAVARAKEEILRVLGKGTLGSEMCLQVDNYMARRRNAIYTELREIERYRNRRTIAKRHAKVLLQERPAILDVVLTNAEILDVLTVPPPQEVQAFSLVSIPNGLLLQELVAHGMNVSIHVQPNVPPSLTDTPCCPRLSPYREKLYEMRVIFGEVLM